MLGCKQKSSLVVFPFIMLASGVLVGTIRPATHLAGAKELFVDFLNSLAFLGQSLLSLTKRVPIVGTPTFSSVSATVPTFLVVAIALAS